ncbi:MAG: Crp/Fnr family transcriptional regulator [Proteobacteria bacterium]|nr:Crp/Fnr family transcriptional regulator [Pseudomonadota bacterium]
MAEDERKLLRNPWLARQSPELREALLAHGRIVRVDAGQWIYGTGDSLNGLYGVLEGSVHLLLTLPDGEARLLDIVQSGNFFGQPARFGGGPRLVTATAGADSRLLYIPDAALAEIGRSQPDVWRNFSTLLYAQLAGALQLAGLLLHLPPRQRVAARLALLASVTDDVAVTQAQLAEMVGLSRKTVNGHLEGLERSGTIERRYGQIVVRDRARLGRVAQIAPAPR